MKEDISIELLSKVLSNGTNIEVKDSEQFNKGLFHIYKLIEESSLLYLNKSYSTSIFLSITVIEEVPKLMVGLFAKKKITKNDPLRDHKKKHILGCNYTISMGKRLNEAIGIDAINKIIDKAQKKELVNLREAALYFDTENEAVISPREALSRLDAREMLLFAIESFDDNLVGLTKYSLDISKKTDEIFKEIADS